MWRLCLRLIIHEVSHCEHFVNLYIFLIVILPIFFILLSFRFGIILYCWYFDVVWSSSYSYLLTPQISHINSIFDLLRLSPKYLGEIAMMKEEDLISLRYLKKCSHVRSHRRTLQTVHRRKSLSMVCNIDTISENWSFFKTRRRKNFLSCEKWKKVSDDGDFLIFEFDWI